MLQWFHKLILLACLIALLSAVDVDHKFVGRNKSHRFDRRTYPNASNISGLVTWTTATTTEYQNGIHTVIVIALSFAICGLTITVILICVVRLLLDSPLKKPLTNSDFVIVNISIGLSLAYLVFLTGVGATYNTPICITSGALIHFFFLVSVSWEGVEAYLLYRTFAATTSIELISIPYFKRTAAAFCWGLPAVIVTIVLAVDTYAYIGKKACWLNATGKASFFATFVGPVCIILLWNCAVFVLVFREIRRAEKLDIRSTRRKTGLRTQIRRGFVLFCLLGLHWILISANAIFNGYSGGVALNVLTMLFCGTQGISLLAIQSYGMRDELRAAYGQWKGRRRASSCVTLPIDGFSSSFSIPRDSICTIDSRDVELVNYHRSM